MDIVFVTLFAVLIVAGIGITFRLYIEMYRDMFSSPEPRRQSSPLFAGEQANINPWEDLNEPAFVRKEWNRLGGTEKGWTADDYYSLRSLILNPVEHDVHDTRDQ